MSLYDLEKTVVKEFANEPGDDDLFKHYVRKEEITRALVEGTPCVALCGKVWVPSKDPDRFPLCEECAEIFASLDDNAQ